MNVPAFQKLGRSFRVSVRDFKGLCLASREALYLFVNRDMAEGPDTGDRGRVVGSAIAGPIGGFIGKRIALATERNEPDYSHLVEFTTVRNLPPGILQHPEWPLRNKSPKIGKLRVLVIPREEVGVIVHPSRSNILVLRFGRVDIVVFYTLFRGKQVRDYLHRAGWPLNWCGWDLIAPDNNRLDPPATRPNRDLQGGGRHR